MHPDLLNTVKNSGSFGGWRADPITRGMNFEP